jgi:hypothetical protein
VAAIGATAVFAIWHSREATLKDHQQDLDTANDPAAQGRRFLSAPERATPWRPFWTPSFACRLSGRQGSPAA